MPRSKTSAPTPRLKLLRPTGCLSPNEAGKKLGVTGEAIKMHIYNGNLKAAKAKNGYWWIRESDLTAFLEGSEKLEFKYHGKGKRSRRG